MDTRATTTPGSAIPDRHGVNAFDDDSEFAALLGLYLSPDLHAHLLPHLRHAGQVAGGRLDELALVADHNPPTLEHRSRTGQDQQRIVKHPAYVEMEKLAFSEFGLAAMSHRAGVFGWPAPMPPAVKYAFTYLFVQAEFGLCCPLSMTDSLTRTLRKFGDPALVERFLDGLLTQDLEHLTQGAMFMTEQGAGSDIAATVTTARQDGDGWRLYGDKWFCSNPDAGLAMVLAHVEGEPKGMRGVSLFLLPARLQDGSANAYRIIRLKDKLGTRSMASGEIRLEGAHAYLVGEKGRGFVQMADMVNNSRLSNGVRAAGMMRRAAAEALHIARNRQAFGRELVNMPLMRRQLAKIILPGEQARSIVFQAAEALRRADVGEEGAYALVRILTPLLKFRACRDARRVTGDAMEVRGGCGYIEEWSDPRLVRDSHLGSIWEGTSNIVAQDVMRAILREDSLPVLKMHLARLLSGSDLHPAARAQFDKLLERSCSFAAGVASKGEDRLTRQAASGLYHIASAISMAWEASAIGSPRRMLLAQLALKHRLMPRDPLQDTDDDALLGILLDDAPDAPGEAGLAGLNLFAAN